MQPAVLENARHGEGGLGTRGEHGTFTGICHQNVYTGAVSQAWLYIIYKRVAHRVVQHRLQVVEMDMDR